MGASNFSKCHLGKKYLYDRGRKLIHFLAGEAESGAGDTIWANLSAAEAIVAHLTGALGQGVSTARTKINQISYVIFLLNFASPFSVMTHNSCEIF